MDLAKKISVFLVVALPAVAAADVYRYTDAEGTACFTDAPVERGAVLIMKEKRDQRREKTQKVPPHLAATGIAGRIAQEPPAQPARGEGMRLPVDGKITSNAGLRHDPIDGKLRVHNGVDIAVPAGTEVRPVASGKIVYAGLRSGYGNVVIVSHPGGMITLYAHNSVNLVQEGEGVGCSSVIARSGSTGRSTGPHLHFEAWNGTENITSRFVAGIAPGADIHEHSIPTRDRIRTVLRSDGSLLFTNLN
jgi:murein DD-endopeptidase MepM/ murein hydrolase activator NlpD